jgi:hypothetical protein
MKVSNGFNLVISPSGGSHPDQRFDRMRQEFSCLRPGRTGLPARTFGGLLQHAETDDTAQNSPPGRDGHTPVRKTG